MLEKDAKVTRDFTRELIDWRSALIPIGSDILTLSPFVGEIIDLDLVFENLISHLDPSHATISPWSSGANFGLDNLYFPSP